MPRRLNQEGSITYNDKRKRFEGKVRYKRENGSYGRKSFVGRTQKEVSMKMEDFLSMTEHPEEKMTVGEWMTKWLLEIKRPTIKVKTYERYMLSFNAYINPNLGNSRIKDLTPMKIQQFLHDLCHTKGKKGNYLAPRTVNAVRRLLMNAFNDALLYGVSTTNPVLGTKAVHVEHNQLHVLGKDEADRLLTVTHEQDPVTWIIVSLALGTGMRIGEIFGLKWKNVDFEKRELLVSTTLVHTNHTNVLQPTGKTKSSYRTIPFGDSLYKALIEYKHWQEQRREELKGYFIDQGFVVTKPNGDFGDPSNFSARTFKKYLKLAGIPTTFRVHDMRHTHATWLLESGVNVKVVSERLGHANIRITLDTYAHVLPKMQDTAVEALDAIANQMKGGGA